MNNVMLALSLEEAQFLKEHLARYIRAVDDELVHTDKREMQRQLATDEAHLRNIERRLAALVEAATPPQ